MKPLRSLSIRLNSASEMPAFFASSLDICLSPLKSIFLKLYFLTTALHLLVLG
jgi:preprotein translocase subunit SecY